MNKEYLPYYDSLDEKYKQIYMEWSKEELIDHLVANIKNGEVLLSRIDEAIEYIENQANIEDIYPDYNEIIRILKGSDKK